MKRRGLRLEVDQPTQWQLRNKRWLASHPVITSLVGGVVFSGMGALYASTTEDSWLSVPVGAAIGLALGALFGWGFSVEHREKTPRGMTLTLYAAIGILMVGLLFAMKLR